MKTIEIETINGYDFYVVHKNFLSPLVKNTEVLSMIGGSVLPRSYKTYFLQNPYNLIKILKEHNGEIIPQYSTVRNLLHSNTAQDIPWIHSRPHSVKNVLITDPGYGEIVTSIRKVYSNSTVDILGDSLGPIDIFTKTLCKNLDVSIVDHPENGKYDAIFIGKGHWERIDCTYFKETYYDKLSSTGEIILVIDETTFRHVYEGDSDFRELFSEYGYASSIKNTGTVLENTIILHIRKESPDYSEKVFEEVTYPNTYVQSFVNYILNDTLLHLKILSYRNKAGRLNTLSMLVNTARIKSYMYLPKVEDHLEFIDSCIC